MLPSLRATNRRALISLDTQLRESTTSVRRLAAFALVFVAGYMLSHQTSTSRRNSPAPYWPTKAPTEIIVSQPVGKDSRCAHHLKVYRVSDSHGRRAVVTGDAQADPWRVVLSTPGGTFYCEAAHVGDDVQRVR
jgi:hypothetical protein